MPASTYRILRLPGSNYMECLDFGPNAKCKPSGRTYSTSFGRAWSGNQRRKRKRFNPPTACSSKTYRPNISTIHQGMCLCGTIPAFAALGPHGPGSRTFGEQSSNGIAERRLQSKALARFSSNAGLGVTLAEATGTLRSLGDRLSAVASILNAIRTRDFRKALSVLHQHTGYDTTRAAARLKARPDRTYADRASSFWLETVFGWVPLLQSIYDSLAVLGDDYRTERRSRASDKANGLRVGIVAEFKTSDGNRFSKLGITNPAEIIWDLVPFSFVIDWFIPIANSIRFFGARSLTTDIWMWSSREWGREWYTSAYQNAVPGVHMMTETNYARGVSVPSISTFTARLPATMWHAVTSAALIQGLRPR